MEEQLIDFDTAELAKEKGFSEPCYHYWDDREFECVLWYDGSKIDKQTDKIVLCPSQSLLQRWLREEHELEVFVVPFDGYEFTVLSTEVLIVEAEGKDFETYEEALEQGLQSALKLL